MGESPVDLVGDFMALAKKRAEAFEVVEVVVATKSGMTARIASRVFGKGYRIIAVGNPASAYKQGLVRHLGMSEEIRLHLVQEGIEVVLQDQSLFQAVSIGGQSRIIGGHDFEIWGHSFWAAPLHEVIEKAGPEGDYNAIAILQNTLRFFGDGPKVCFEVAVMAADASVITQGTDCISIACPAEWPYAAMVLQPPRTEDIFKKNWWAKDLILAPGQGGLWLFGPRWKG